MTKHKTKVNQRGRRKGLIRRHGDKWNSDRAIMKKGIKHIAVQSGGFFSWVFDWVRSIPDKIQKKYKWKPVLDSRPRHTLKQVNKVNRVQNRRSNRSR